MVGNPERCKRLADRIEAAIGGKADPHYGVRTADVYIATIDDFRAVAIVEPEDAEAIRALLAAVDYQAGEIATLRRRLASAESDAIRRRPPEP